MNGCNVSMLRMLHLQWFKVPLHVVLIRWTIWTFWSLQVFPSGGTIAGATRWHVCLLDLQAWHVFFKHVRMCDESRSFYMQTGLKLGKIGGEIPLRVKHGRKIHIDKFQSLGPRLIRLVFLDCLLVLSRAIRVCCRWRKCLSSDRGMHTDPFWKPVFTS